MKRQSDLSKNVSRCTMQWNGVTIPRIKWNVCWYQNNSSTSEGQNVVLKWWSTLQHGTMANIFSSNSLINTGTGKRCLSHMSQHYNFCHYCFTHHISVIIEHKLLVAIFKKDVLSPSYKIQRITLHSTNITLEAGKNQGHNIS